MYTGPNIERDGLVFGYDTHDYSRFYNGPATTNHLLSLTHSFGNTIRTNGKAVAGTEEVNIPTIGKRNVKYIEYYNNYNNGNDMGCCPNLFNYHSGGTVPLVGSQSYTYSIVYKHTGGYTHPNFMYRYRYKADNTYISEGGLHSTARRTHLGDGWYHAWGSWVTDPGANYGRFYSFLYNYGTVVNRYYVAAISLVKNNSGSEHLIIPPNLLLEPNTFISPSNSILDLTKTTNIDVSNVSFDSTGQPTFDGTDDTIALGNSSQFNITDSMSVFTWIKPDNVSSWNGIFGGSVSGFVHFQLYNGGVNVYVYGPNASYGNPDGVSIGNNVWTNVGFTFGNNTLKVYVNGVQLPTTPTGNGANISGNSDVRFGWAYATSRLFQGRINVATVHNRELTSEEVTQTYNSYKNRFDI